MRFIGKKTIKLDKEINELDNFVFKFIRLLEKHTDYVIVSGYVAVILGRNRGTDDVDIIIPRMDKSKLSLLYKNLIKNGYWCLNSGDIDDLCYLLKNKSSIRFAIKPKVSPNIEIKFSKDSYDEIALKNPITIMINDESIKTSFLELQIAYKEEVLKSNKDIEDAQFLREISRGFIDNRLVEDYKKRLREK